MACACGHLRDDHQDNAGACLAPECAYNRVQRTPCPKYREADVNQRQAHALERIADSLEGLLSLLQGWDHNGAALDVAVYGTASVEVEKP